MRRVSLPSQRGAVMLVVLWVVALLALMTFAFSLEGARQARQARLAVDMAIIEAKAEAVIWRGLLEMLLSNAVALPRDGRFIERDEGRAQLSIQASNGLIDINRADADYLEALLAQFVEEEDRRLDLVGAWLDWRDADDLVRPQGAEQQTYRQAGLEHGPGDRDFAAVEELALVMGMTPDLYRQLAPLVTVHGEGLDRLVAPREVLVALPGAQPEQVEALLALREGAAREAVVRRTRMMMHTYEFRAITTGPDGMRRGVRAVIRLHPGRSPPFSVLEWGPFSSGTVSPGVMSRWSYGS